MLSSLLQATAPYSSRLRLIVAQERLPDCPPHSLATRQRISPGWWRVEAALDVIPTYPYWIAQA